MATKVARLLVFAMYLVVIAPNDAGALEINYRLDNTEDSIREQFPNAKKVVDGVYEISDKTGAVALVGFGPGGASYRATRLRARLAESTDLSVSERGKIRSEIAKLDQLQRSSPKASVSGLRCSDWYMSMEGNVDQSGPYDSVITSSDIEYVGPYPPFGPPSGYGNLNVFAASTAVSNVGGSPVEVYDDDYASAGHLGAASALAIASCGLSGCYLNPNATYAIAEASWQLEGCSSGFVEWTWTAP